jgi:hypothetical protein
VMAGITCRLARSNGSVRRRNGRSRHATPTPGRPSVDMWDAARAYS